jgi:hypothetical protein
MVLWIALSIALIAGLLDPFAGRLHATSLWAGKALVDSEFASAFPSGLQDSLTGHRLSKYCLFVTSLPYTAAIVGFFHSWWGGVVAFISSIIVAAISNRTPLASHTVDRYIAFLMEYAYQRSADYAAKGDMQRAKAAKDLAGDLQGLFTIYLNSGVPAPTLTEARSAPHGDPEFLIRTYMAREADEGQSDKAISDFVDSVRNDAVERGAMTREGAERMITPDKLQDLASLPQRDVEIAGEYGRVLAEVPGPLRPLSKLPYPKETIRRAIEKLLARSQDPEYRNLLKTVLLALDDFVPDEEVPSDKEENKRKWLKDRLGVERQGRANE